MIKYIYILLLIFLFSSCSLDNDLGKNNKFNNGLAINNTREVIKIKEELDLIDSDSLKGYVKIKSNYSENKSKSSFINLIRVSLDLGKFNEVIKLWESIDDKTLFSEYNGEVFGDVIFSYIYLGKFNEAEKLISNYINEYSHFDIYSGILSYYKGDYNKSILLLKESSGSKFKINFYLGKNYFKLKDYKNSEFYFLKLRKLTEDETGKRKYVYLYHSLDGLIKIYDILGKNEVLNSLKLEKANLDSKVLYDDSGLEINKNDIYKFLEIYSISN